MTVQRNYVRYNRAQGQAFVDAITAIKPIAVHAQQISSEHDEVYSFSFFDRKKTVHDYMHEIDDYNSTVIGPEQMNHFAQLYGVSLVGGSVEYHSEERYHFFDSARAREYRGFRPKTTYQAWQDTLKEYLNGKKRKAFVRALSGSFEVIVDVPCKKDHFVLRFRPTKGQGLSDIIRDNLRGYETIDVTPYAEWLRTMRRGA